MRKEGDTDITGTELIRYRRTGGMAGLRQDLRVYDDGRVVLEDGRAGTTTELAAGASELANLQSVVDSVPPGLWHGVGKQLLRRALPAGPNAMRFELRSSLGRVGGAAGRVEAEVAPLVAQLDELLARCVREGRPDA